MVLVAIVLGTIIPVDTVWMFSDFFNALMVIPNWIGIVLLSGTVVKKFDEWKKLDKEIRKVSAK